MMPEETEEIEEIEEEEEDLEMPSPKEKVGDMVGMIEMIGQEASVMKEEIGAKEDKETNKEIIVQGEKKDNAMVTIEIRDESTNKVLMIKCRH